LPPKRRDSVDKVDKGPLGRKNRKLKPHGDHESSVVVGIKRRLSGKEIP
jgi:hypothetical protein